MSFYERANVMTIMTDLNAKTLVAMKENNMFRGFLEFLEFGGRDSLMVYFDALFSERFLAQ